MKKITIVTLIFTFIFLSVYIFVLYFVDPLVLIENKTKDEVIVYTCKVDCSPPIKLSAGEKKDMGKLGIKAMSLLHVDEKKIKLHGGQRHIIKITNSTDGHILDIEKTGY